MARVCRLLLLLALGAGLAAPAAPSAQAADETLLLRFRPGTTPAEAAAALAEAGLEAERRIRGVGVQVATVPAGEAGAVLTELRHSPDVLFAERDGLVGIAALTGDPLVQERPWPFTLTRLATAWELTGGAGVTVAVVDTGVSPHQDLANLLPGRDVLNGDADASDDNGHGTAVAGIVAATAGNGQGAAGACWGCAVMPVKALGPDGYGTWSAVAAGITWAVDHGADVVNLSLGAPGASLTVKAAVDYATARGVLVVAAAGNAGSSTPFYPANFPGVLAVAASDESDSLYAFSNHGEWIEVSAPGCAASLRHTGGFGDFCGTSAAAPFVSGLLALARAYAPGAPAPAVADAVLTTAQPVAGVVAGRIDARAALEALGAPRALAPPQNVVPPRIRGRFTLGRRLRAFAGSWSGDGPIAFSYRWLRCGRTRCVPAGNRPSRVVRRRDLGYRLRLVVVATNAAGAAEARSRVSRRVRQA